MPKIKLTVPHALGKEEAKRRIADSSADATRLFGDRLSDFEQSWNGDVQSFRFRTMGFAVAGQLSLENAAIHVELQVPFAALLVKDRVEKEILSHATALLA